MNKIIYFSIVLSCMIFTSCDRTGVAENIFEDKVINQTNKELFNIVYFAIGHDSAYCHANDSVSLIFIKKVNWSMPFIGPYEIDEGEYPEPIKAFIFNLSDTTSIRPEYEITEEDRKLIISKFEFHTRRRINTVYITDSYLTLFKKDYTMLDRFKEYYKK